MLKQVYNPDVLTCIANLSSDEVFTPPSVVNQMLDTLPKELWSDEKVTFLDPVSKSGVFLREITKRLIDGLESKIPNLEERIEHILRNQVFGIGITELTSLISRRSLYCSKYANGEYSIVQFDDEQGNLKYFETEHTWKSGSCKYCGVSKEVYDRGNELENYAYSFIHSENPEKLLNMKFDVIVGNPPYQLETGGTQRQAKPIYQKFIDTSIKLNPRYIVKIIPSRWFSGGMGLKNFREKMINDKRLKKIFDFENSSDIFPGVDIAGGVCYFLWDKNHSGKCEFNSVNKDETTTVFRYLNKFDILIRNSKSIPIIEKIQEKFKLFLTEKVSSTKPFGISTNYKSKNEGFRCFFKKSVGMGFVSREDLVDKHKILQKWKVVVPEAPITGQTDFSKPIKFYHNQNVFILKPGVCCSESWIVLNSFDTENEAKFFKTYVFTKIFRFLVLQTVISQHVNRKNFSFVPDLESYSIEYSDKILIELMGITNSEWDYINSRIQEPFI